MSSPRRRAPTERARARRGGAPWVLLALASLWSLCWLLAARPATAEEQPVPAPLRLGSAESGVEVLVYPPRDRATPRPVTVMLHGMCDEPEAE